jgi:RNA polymerase sigma factor (sigma-70 family)
VPQDLKNLTDLELLSLYTAKDDKKAIGILFERYYHLVFGVSMKYLKESNLAKDMCMTVFEKIILDVKRHKIDYFKAWLYRVVQNECLMALRKNKKITMSTDEISLSNMESVDTLHLVEEKEELLNEMNLALEQLPPDQKECVTLFYIERKSYSDICSATGFTFMQVKSFIQNGKRNLKNRLSSQI